MDSMALVMYKQKLISVLNSFDSFCKDNDLKYYASYGTAIGAVRHKGIIPWDDDIDLYMPREDYDKLIAIRHSLEGTGYSISCLGDADYIYSFAKYYDSNTTLIETSSFPRCVIGVYIDIFPLDNVSEDFRSVKDKKDIYRRAYRAFQDTYRLITLRSILSCVYHRQFSRLGELLKVCFMSTSKKEQIRKCFRNLDLEWASEAGTIVMNHSCIYDLEKELFPQEWFDEYLYFEFENTQVRLPKEYDKYLTQLYGDYMTPPPVHKRESSHSHFYLNLKERLSIDEILQRIINGEYLVY